MFGEKIEVNGIFIHYEKVGSGKNVLLLLPGGLGTTRTDFSPQLYGFDKSKFTLIAWDPPGYGFSRPHERNYNPKLFENDADLAAMMMKNLGYKNYSVLGWSDGGKAALFMAIKYQSNVEKCVVWGVALWRNKQYTIVFQGTKDFAIWDQNLLQSMTKVYGKDEFKNMWGKHVDFFFQFGP